MKIKVRQMTSDRSGNPVANQFIIETARGRYFQSYKSIIAFKNKNTGKVTLDKIYWDYSVTTMKYLKKFLGGNAADTRAKIKSGMYSLANLN
tara:strand:- start:193 stop:468 length:276 start_codon:yes stop_codon:yes gene_type:complete